MPSQTSLIRTPLLYVDIIIRYEDLASAKIDFEMVLFRNPASDTQNCK